ncbi:DUF2568 domain-containing protein [Enterococcus sp. AZ072]|uniref:DUF2568 domain-containing protein n=1 Tax=unclassified Enterococcus TaxID=2608891 RepID=UPI003D275633
MTLLAGLTLSIRFILEIGTVIGLASGVFIQKPLSEKVLFCLLASGITLVWAKYGAPKSATHLTGIYKLILEIIVYSIGIFGIWRIFGIRLGLIYAFFVVSDLMMMYLLELQGN